MEGLLLKNSIKITLEEGFDIMLHENYEKHYDIAGMERKLEEFKRKARDYESMGQDARARILRNEIRELEESIKRAKEKKAA
jgi:hypothetical protein